MKEIFEFRINLEFYHLLTIKNNGRFNGSCYIVTVSTDDPLFDQIRQLYKEIKEKNNELLFWYSNVRRIYSTEEFNNASFLHLLIKSTFEPAGEECGTVYNYTSACDICGSNRKQIGLLRLKKSSLPKTDISMTIAGEIVVSERFADEFLNLNLKGVTFQKIELDKGLTKSLQLIVSSPEIELTNKTIAGINIFNMATDESQSSEITISGKYKIKFNKEVYKCPRGHTVGLNLISVPHVLKTSLAVGNDLFASRQKVGVKRGLLRPVPIYICSAKFRKMTIDKNLKGFDFQIAEIDNSTNA